MRSTKLAVRIDTIERRILIIRGEKVIVDADLAEFYGVRTKRLNEQVRRNRERFPEDFVFRLTPEEKAEVVAKCDHLANLRFSKSRPYAFTEHGALMAASVLSTHRAVEVGVFVVRAFVSLRQIHARDKEVANRLNRLEARIDGHDGQIMALVQSLRRLTCPVALPEKRRIGFRKEGS